MGWKMTASGPPDAVAAALLDAEASVDAASDAAADVAAAPLETAPLLELPVLQAAKTSAVAPVIAAAGRPCRRSANREAEARRSVLAARAPRTARTGNPSWDMDSSWRCGGPRNPRIEQETRT